MQNEIEYMKRKFKAQNEILDSEYFADLDKRTIRNIIIAMLINTTNDGISYANKLIAPIDDREQILDEDELNKTATLYGYCNNSLCQLLLTMMKSVEIKESLKNDMPNLYSDIYFVINAEETLCNEIVDRVFKNQDKKKSILKIIDETIGIVMDNAEEYIDNLQTYQLYDVFVKLRENWRKSKGEMNNGQSY